MQNAKQIINSQYNIIEKFIKEYFNKCNNISITKQNELKEILFQKFKLTSVKTLEYIDNYLLEYNFTAIMINNSESFNNYADRYYNQLQDKGTELNFEFFQKLSDWIAKVPEDNKLEIAKRMFVYEYLAEKEGNNENQ